MGTRQRGTVRIESASWRGYWHEYVTNPSTGKTQRKQRSVRLGPRSLGKKEAREILSKEIARVTKGDGTPSPDGSITFEEFARSRWLPTKEAKWRSHTDSKGRVINPAKVGAEQTLGHIFKRFGKVPLEQIESSALQRWLNEMGQTRADSVVKHCRYYLKSILEWAVWEDYLRKNPAKFLELPKTKAVSKTTLTPEQLTAVLKEVDPKYSLLIRVGLFCAFRPSELLALRWRDFDPVKKTFTIRETLYRGVLRPFTKTTDEGSGEQHLLTVAIPEVLVEELSTFRGPHKGDLGVGIPLGAYDNDFIFSSDRWTPLHKENILHRVFTPVRKKLNLPALNFQVLRRTFTTLAQNTGSVKDLQTQLRHKTADTTVNEYMQPVSVSVHSAVNAVYAKLITP
jgi:integrase